MERNRRIRNSIRECITKVKASATLHYESRLIAAEAIALRLQRHDLKGLALITYVTRGIRVNVMFCIGPSHHLCRFVHGRYRLGGTEPSGRIELPLQSEANLDLLPWQKYSMAIHLKSRRSHRIWVGQWFNQRNYVCCLGVVSQ